MTDGGPEKAGTAFRAWSHTGRVHFGALKPKSQIMMPGYRRAEALPLVHGLTNLKSAE
jgi:hypothetical protein